MRRCARASSPTIRQRSMASRKPGRGGRRNCAVQCVPLVDTGRGLPIVPPGRRRADIRKTVIRLTEGLLPENSAVSDGMKPRSVPAKLMPTSVYPQIAQPHNLITSASFSTSLQVPWKCRYLCVRSQTSNIQKRLVTKTRPQYTSYACITRQNPPPAQVTRHACRLR